MRYPFEATVEDLELHIDTFVDAVFSSLESEFLVMPKGKGFVEYQDFEGAYEDLKRGTDAFHDLRPEAVTAVADRNPRALLVLRAMLGFTPSEWAYAAAQHSGIDVSQGFARALDRRIRLGARGLSQNAITSNRVGALVDTACSLLRAGPDVVAPDKLHRLEKADTQSGQESLLAVSGLGVPYAMLLYERFLGRPFAGHRDSVSELVGDALESAVEDVLHARQVSYRKTRRAEKLPGFDQAPDFVIPSEYNPQVIIEAKLTEDDGTARDKVTRVQHLFELSLRGTTSEAPRFEVIACIAGRGFGVRREDMRKLLLATRGKVFTLRTLDRLVDCTGLMQFSSR
ncbi:MAG: hypothetical protein ACUVX9_13645 [Anaerolineae bacterium]